MGYHHDGELHLCLNLADEREDNPRGLRVERARRLVAEKHVGFVCKGTGYRDPLLLPARKGTDGSVRPVLKADEGKHFPHAFLGLRLAHPADFERIGDVPPRCPRGEEVEVLENHPDFAPLLNKGGLVQIVHPPVVVVDRPLVRGFQQAHQADERGLASPALSDDAEYLVLGDSQAVVPDRLNPLVPRHVCLRKVFQSYLHSLMAGNYTEMAGA